MIPPLFAVGFTAVIGQVLLMRELVATFYGNELLFGLILAAWLAWGALGSTWASRRHRVEKQAVAAGLALAALVLPAQLVLVRGVRSLMGVTPGAFVEFAPMVAAAALIPAPLCALLGSTFALAARLIRAPDPGARAYLWESSGAVFGGIVFSFLLIRWLDPLQTALLVGGLNLTTAAALLLPRSLSRSLPCPTAPLLLGSLVLLTIGALVVGHALHTTTLSWQWSDLIFATDSPYGRHSVVARAGQRAFFTNGLLTFETQSTFPEEVVHLPLLAHPAPRSVLLVGGGVAGDLREILRHPTQEIVYVELDPAVIRAAREHLPHHQAAVLDDPRVHLILSDGRRYVQTADRDFDAIILDLPEPSTGALNRFYTQEFFTEAQALLNRGGILSLGLPSAENYWSPELARRNASVYWSLREIFPHVLVLPGEHNFFLASDQPLPSAPEELSSQMEERGIEPRRVTPDYIEYLFTTDRFAQVQGELADMGDVRRNRDRRPICYYYDLVLWLSRFYPRLLGELRELPLQIGTLVVLAGMIGLARWRRGLAVPLAVAAVGLAEMALEVVILFAFQIGHGTLYGRVSLVVTVFMAGLVAGALAGRRLTQWAHQVLLGIVGGVAALGALLTALPVSASVLAYVLLALAAGGFAGAAFPLALTLVSVEESQAAGLLYAADLAGGCLGALVTAALFVPLLGLDQTAVLITLVGVAGMVMLI